MKRIFTGIIVLTAIAFSASAQQSDQVNVSKAQTERRHSKDRINPRLLEQLNLTATQKEQVKVINDEYRAKMQEMIKSEIPAEQRKDQRTVFEKERKDKIMAVLTAEQQQKLAELQRKEISEVVDERENKAAKERTGYKEKIKVDDKETKIKVKSD
jgi:Spy/CpxP family protein refolding chaperone